MWEFFEDPIIVEEAGKSENSSVQGLQFSTC